MYGITDYIGASQNAWNGKLLMGLHKSMLQLIVGILNN